MKFLQIDSFYPAYIQEMYAENPALASAGFSTQVSTLLQGGFSLAHNVALMMPKHGYQASFIIPNAANAQAQWLREAGQALSNPQAAFHETVLRQIDSIKPDILYLSDVLSLNSAFLRRLSWRPRLIIGWHAAPGVEQIDFSAFDVMVSSHAGCREAALRQGAAAVEPFAPGLPRDLADQVKNEPKLYDVIFSGQIGEIHRKRTEHLLTLVRAEALRKAGVSLGLFLVGKGPSELAAYVRPPVWGLEMYRTLRRARIVLNVHVDMAFGAPQNMRIFETLAVGSFLLTDHDGVHTPPFMPDQELGTFTSPDHMIEKILHYLRHTDERETIAQAGQRRCLAEHSMEHRAAWLDDIIQRHLACKTASTS